MSAFSMLGVMSLHKNDSSAEPTDCGSMQVACRVRCLQMCFSLVSTPCIQQSPAA